MTRHHPASSPTRPASLAAALLIALAACAPPAADTPAQESPEPRPDAASLADARVVDLTHALGEDSIYWPTGSPFDYERVSWGENDAGDWYAAGTFSTAEHLGTHVDAPIHFAPDVWTADEIPVQRLVAAAVVVDISARAAEDPDTTLRPADLEAWEAEHGRIPEGAILLVRSGWAERWPDWNRYYGTETPFEVDTLHFPGVSPEAAEALVERGVAGVGIDTASIDPGNDTEFRAHRVLARGRVFNLENLTGLDELPASGAILVAAPLKIEGGSGGPARVIALIPGVG